MWGFGGVGFGVLVFGGKGVGGGQGERTEWEREMGVFFEAYMGEAEICSSIHIFGAVLFPPIYLANPSYSASFTALSTALATYSTLPSFNPAILILPFFVIYTCASSLNFSTCFSLNPVKLNMPI